MSISNKHSQEVNWYQTEWSWMTLNGRRPALSLQ